MARQSEQTVVSVRVDAHRACAERRDELLDQLDARDIGGRQRRQEPGRCIEEIGRRAGGPARVPACDRVAGDEPLVLDRCERALRRADVGDRRVSRCAGENVPRRLDKRPDRNGDDDEPGSGDGVGE